MNPVFHKRELLVACSLVACLSVSACFALDASENTNSALGGQNGGKVEAHTNWAAITNFSASTQSGPRFYAFGTATNDLSCKLYAWREGDTVDLEKWYVFVVSHSTNMPRGYLNLPFDREVLTSLYDPNGNVVPKKEDYAEQQHFMSSQELEAWYKPLAEARWHRLLLPLWANEERQIYGEINVPQSFNLTVSGLHSFHVKVRLSRAFFGQSGVVCFTNLDLPEVVVPLQVNLHK